MAEIKIQVKTKTLVVSLVVIGVIVAVGFLAFYQGKQAGLNANSLGNTIREFIK